MASRNPARRTTFGGKQKAGTLRATRNAVLSREETRHAWGGGVGGDFEKLELGALAVLGTQEVLTSHTGGFPH